MKTKITGVLSWILILSTLLSSASCRAGEDIDPERTPVPDSTETAPLPDTETIKKIDVTETGGTASVSHDSGLQYEASGYRSVNDDGVFQLKEGMTLDFLAGCTFPCSRFVLTYSSDAPLRIRVTYSTDAGATAEDEFFLEAAENGVFKGLVSGYMDGGSSETVQKMTVVPCKSETAAFALHDFSGDIPEVISGDICYIENNRFKLGVKLTWGGGINYIEDKTYREVEGLQNLANMHDTGRLIQQSYYGTGGIPGVYEPGSFNGSASWAYNPVQGGDKYNNKSRLIDFSVTENSIYVKAQPQDWSLDGKITPSYMENVYTVTEEYIEVYNRFTDFSGWIHDSRDQELPAFYAVSYLDTYVFYNGTAPWSGDTLTVKPDLPFWGNAADHAKCRFPLCEGNTETWSAWVNGETGWGIGLYTPNIDCLLAGRYAFNGSKNPRSGACSYIAALNEIRLTSFLPLSYSYLITTGTIEEIRAVFAKNRDFADNASLSINRRSMRIADE